MGKAIAEDISEILRTQLKDPRIGFVSVLRAEVSRDLRHARVFITVLGDESQQKDSMEGINSAAGFLRSELSRRLGLRFMPMLEFRLDKSIEHGVRIAKILNEVLPPGPATSEAERAEPQDEE